MVELALAPPKVARRAVRILVLTVRFATSRRRATPPWVVRNRAVPRTHRSGGSLCLIGGESGSRPVTQRTGHGRVRRPGIHGRIGRGSRDGGRAVPGRRSRTGAGSERLARWPSLAATRAQLVRRGPHRRAGTVTAPTWYLSGGRRKPPWSRTELGEWSPRDEKSVYNRSGREDLQSRTSDREQVVRLGPLAWISHPRLAGSSHPAGASPAVPQGAWNALGRPRSRGLS